MYRTTLHRQVTLAVALVALALTGAVAGVAVAQTDVSTFGNDSAVAENGNSTAGNVTATVVHDGERLELSPTGEQTIAIRTNADAGTELNVIIRENGMYTDQYEATVSEDGTATVGLNLGSVEPGTNVSVTVRRGEQTLTKANGVVSSPSVTFAEGDRLVLHAAENQTVAIESNAPAGTELSVTLRSAKYNMLKSSSVTVSEDGTGTATFDLSNVAPGTTFRATASEDADAEARGIVVNESATVHRDATFVPADADSNVTIRGRAMDRAVTKLDVRVAPEGESATQNKTVTVGEDRTFAATFDLSALPADTEVSVEVGGIPRSVTAIVVTEAGRAPTVYAFAETPPNATIRYPQETVLVHPAANQTVYGETNLRPGTELTVTAVRDQRNSPDDFTRTANVTVDESGRFAADLNFSGIEPGTNFSIRVGRGLTMADGRVVNESVTLPTVTATESETETSGPAVPGFGVSVAVGALLAGLALARRA